MADNPKLDLGSCVRISDGLEENLGTQKISVLDHLKGFEYKTEKSENFVIDMESFSNGSSNKDPNSRITLQRSLSRKGSSRGGVGGGGGGGSDTGVPASSSPRATLVGSSMPEKASLVAAAVPADHSINNPQVPHHHQITINTTASNTNASSTEGRFTLRRNSFKRPPFSWAVDPKRVLFFFATLSSMGTILLIYFTLSIGKFGEEETGLD